MKNSKIILFSVFIIASQYWSVANCALPLIAAGVDPCDQYESCSTLGAGVLVPNPLDCHSYYLCIDEIDGSVVPSDHSLECSAGQYFNPDSLQCEVQTEPCYRPCLNVNCEFECDIEAEFTYNIADPDSCVDYFICVPGTGSFLNTCPVDQPYFNGVDCGGSLVECCQGCIPYCHNVSIETRDPNDCRKYYICTEFGVPTEDFHFTCKEGFYFDHKLGVCSSGTECESLCLSGSSSEVPPLSTAFQTIE